VIARQASFADAKDILTEIVECVDGVILDLGMSSDQIEFSGRGFSFRAAARLDMRMTGAKTVDARQIVNAFALDQLERIFRVYGEEPRARRIAQANRRRAKTDTLETNRTACPAYRAHKRQGSARSPSGERRFSKHCESL